jgi:hypothetical protein
LIFIYRRAIEKYYELLNKETKSEVKKNLEMRVGKYVQDRIDTAVTKALVQASKLISKNAKSVVDSMKRKSVKYLIEEKQAEDRATALEFDEARREIEKYKQEKYEEIRMRASEVLSKVARDALSGLLDDRKQEELVLRAIEDAKRSKVF